MDLEQPDLGLPGQEAAGEEGGVPVHRVPDRGVDADAHRPLRLGAREVVGQVERRRELDRVVRPVLAAGLADVLVGGVGEVEAGEHLEAAQMGDTGGVVAHRRGVGGAGHEGAGLAGGAAAVLGVAPGSGEGGGARQEHEGGGEQDEGDGRTGTAHGVPPAGHVSRVCEGAVAGGGGPSPAARRRAYRARGAVDPPFVPDRVRSGGGW